MLGRIPTAGIRDAVTKIRSTDASRIQDRRGQGGGGGHQLPRPGRRWWRSRHPDEGRRRHHRRCIVAARGPVPAQAARRRDQQPLDRRRTSARKCRQPRRRRARPSSSRSSAAAPTTCRSTGSARSPQRSTASTGKPTTVFFSGATNTGCGQASAQIGPFYCPADGLVYFDLDFLTQLQNQFGATGDLAAQYIVAHEYGHHVQNVLGISAEVQPARSSRTRRTPTATRSPSSCRPTASPARGHATPTSAACSSRARSARRSTPPSAVGDDRIQQQAGPAGRTRTASPTGRRSSACSGSGAATTPAIRSSATRSTRCCSQSGTTSTGHGARRTSRAATLPPDRPAPTTTIVAGVEADAAGRQPGVRPAPCRTAATVATSRRRRATRGPTAGTSTLDRARPDDLDEGRGRRRCGRPARRRRRRCARRGPATSRRRRRRSRSHRPSDAALAPDDEHGDGGARTMRALVPTHWHHAPDHDRYESSSSAVEQPPRGVRRARRRRLVASTAQPGDDTVADRRASLRRRTRCRHRCAGRGAPRTASSPSGRRSRSTGMAMRSVTAAVTPPSWHAQLGESAGSAAQPAVEPLGGADAAAAVPPRRRRRWRRPSRRRRTSSAVSSPAGSTQPSQSTTRLNTRAWATYSVRLIAPAWRSSSTGARAGEALGQPRDRRRRRRAPCRARSPCTPGRGSNGSVLASVTARWLVAGRRRHHRRQAEQRHAATDRRDPPPVRRQHAAEHDAGAEERQPRQQRVGAVDDDVEEQRPRRA